MEETKFTLICDQLKRMKSQVTERLLHLTCASCVQHELCHHNTEIIMNEFFVQLTEELKTFLVEDEPKRVGIKRRKIDYQLWSASSSEVVVNRNAPERFIAGSEALNRIELERAVASIVDELKQSKDVTASEHSFDKSYVESNAVQFQTFSPTPSPPLAAKPHYWESKKRDHFPCPHPECHHLYYSKAALNAHKKCHSDLNALYKPYRCKWTNCGYAASRLTDARTHVRVVHLQLPRTARERRQAGLVDDQALVDKYIEDIYDK